MKNIIKSILFFSSCILAFFESKSAATFTYTSYNTCALVYYSSCTECSGSVTAGGCGSTTYNLTSGIQVPIGFPLPTVTITDPNGNPLSIGGIPVSLTLSTAVTNQLSLLPSSLSGNYWAGYISNAIPIPPLGNSSFTFFIRYTWPANQPGFGSTPTSMYVSDNSNTICSANISNYTYMPIYPGNIPTLSEWALLILSLLSLAMGMIFISKRQRSFAFASGSESVSTQNKSLFNRSLFLKVYAIILGLSIMALVASFAYFGSVTRIDTLGTIVSASIVAYMVHLFLLRKNRNT